MSVTNEVRPQHHTQLSPGDVGRYVLLPGDPARCEPIAALFDSAVHVASNREYTTWTGMLDGEKVSVVSTGIGCPSTAIAVEELVKIGADTFIRVGNAGAMQPDIPAGQLAIVTAAIRDEGTTTHYLPIEFPAVADFSIVGALVAAAEKVGASYRLGVAQSKDSFFGEWEPDRMPVAGRLRERWKAWIEGGAICSEMEVAALFVIGSINRMRTGGVMYMWPEGEDAVKDRIQPLLETAVGALRILIAQDRASCALRESKVAVL